MPSQDKRWLKTKEVAEYLGLNIHSVREAIREKVIPAAKVKGLGIRVDREALDKFLEKQAHQAN